MKLQTKLIFILSFIVMGLPAAVAPVGGEHAMIDGVGGHQSSPSMALWSSGGLVAWANSSSTGSNRIAVQALDGQGQSTGSVQVVSQNVEGVHDTDPEVVAVNETTGVVVWSSGPRNNTDIYLALVTRTGARLGEIQRVNQTLQRGQSRPSVGVSAEGMVAVVWQSENQDGDGQGVYGRMYSSAGAAVGGEVLLSQTTAGNQSDPGVLGLDGNRFLMTWVSGVVNGRNEVGGLKLRSHVMGRFFEGSVPRRNEFKVSGSDVIVQAPATHMGGDGSVHVAWMQRTEINSQDKFDIWGVSLNASTGMPAGAAVKINDFSSGQQMSPQIVSRDNEVVYVWESVGQDLGGHGIVGKAYPGGDEFVINSQRNLDQYDPAVAVNPEGRVIVAWANTIRADYSVISAQHFVVGDGPVPAALEVVSGQAQPSAVLEALPSSPSAPSLVTPDEIAEAPRVVNGVSSAPAPVAASAPSFPEPAASRAVAANTFRRSGLPPGAQRSAPAAQGGASFGQRSAPANMFSMNRFPNRSSLGSAREAASSAMRQMSDLRRPGGLSGASNNRSGFSTRLSGAGSRGSGASLTRSGMMNPALAQAAAGGSRFGQRSGTASRAPSFASRNSAGVGPVRGLSAMASRNGSQAAARAGGASAQSRFTQIRESAQRAGRDASGSQQVPAGLQVSGQNLSINWNARAGSRYQVQGSNDQRSWNNHGGVRNGRSGQNSAAVDRSFRYYRVVESK